MNISCRSVIVGVLLVMVWWNGAHLVGTFVHASRPGLSPLPFSVTTVDELRVPGMAGALIHRAQRLHDGRNDAAWAVQSTANAAGTTGDAGTANAVGTAEPAGASLTLALRVAPWVRSAEIQAVILIPAAEGTAPPAWVMIDNERFALNPAPQPTTIWISPRVADTLSLTVSSASAPTEPRAAAVGLAEIVLLGTTATRYYLRSSYR